MTSTPSPRMLIAAEYADWFGVVVQRIAHNGRSPQGKRFYRIDGPRVQIDVMYPTWIVVNGEVARSKAEADKLIAAARR